MSWRLSVFGELFHVWCSLCQNSGWIRKMKQIHEFSSRVFKAFGTNHICKRKIEFITRKCIIFLEISQGSPQNSEGHVFVLAKVPWKLVCTMTNIALWCMKFLFIAANSSTQLSSMKWVYRKIGFLCQIRRTLIAMWQFATSITIGFVTPNVVLPQTWEPRGIRHYFYYKALQNFWDCSGCEPSTPYLLITLTLV